MTHSLTETQLLRTFWSCSTTNRLYSLRCFWHTKSETLSRTNDRNTSMRGTTVSCSRVNGTVCWLW